MTTREILKRDKERLRKVEGAIDSLAFDTRSKSVELREKFIEMRENLLISIESNETALWLENIIKND